MADEQKDIPSQIVTLKEFLLQKLILLGDERACKSVRATRDILATNQTDELRKLFGPSQFDEQGAQTGDPTDIGGCGKWRHLGSQVRHPAEDMGVATQLLNGLYFLVSGAEKAEEVTHD
jgi:hypothetical protein